MLQNLYDSVVWIEGGVGADILNIYYLEAYGA